MSDHHTPEACLQRLQATLDELMGLRAGRWPPEDLVPVESRPGYLGILEVQRDRQVREYLRALALDHIPEGQHLVRRAVLQVLGIG